MLRTHFILIPHLVHVKLSGGGGGVDYGCASTDTMHHARMNGWLLNDI